MFPHFCNFAFLSPIFSRYRQCWRESPLHTVAIQTSLDGLKEYVLPTQPYSRSTAKAEKESEYAPWSHPPICTSTLPGINDTLCVYTSPSFASGRGISLFTIPSLAHQFAALPAFQAPLPPHINKPTHTYHTSAIPGKGIGMLASQALSFGDRVTAHTPAFIAYLESELSTPLRETWWRTAVDRLPEGVKKEFMGLTYVYGDERVRVQDIVKANTFQIEVGGVNHLVVWPETSRLNHACAPNAQYVIDTDTLTHYVHVTRPIAPGEEITISYTPPLTPTQTRQSQLHHGFNFICTCPRCKSPTSDETLSRIQTLQAHLNDWSPASPASPAMAEELLQLYCDEGLQGFMDAAYGFAALAYGAVGDADAAVRYAGLAREAIEMKDGRGVPNFGLWEGFLEGGARAHWSWRRRV
ncbi:SET domain-containing protein [Decorospora gaudefroyi]|uniref:SET domain-containing protein n=1 Tax=Decorospora gaudefroyi TaxID=184978 RepID=A0A6A5JYA7_9PLEO|nr:SET domain-containing protein [Decorospora gaudefroyi]